MKMSMQGMVLGKAGMRAQQQQRRPVHRVVVLGEVVQGNRVGVVMVRQKGEQRMGMWVGLASGVWRKVKRVRAGRCRSVLRRQQGCCRRRAVYLSRRGPNRR